MTMSTFNRRIRRVGVTAAILAVGMIATSTAAHAEPQGHLAADLPVGYLYATFDQGGP
jgi:hypothetical protein